MSAITVTLKEKLENQILSLIKDADETGKGKLPTCNARNWDQDIWSYRHQIMNELIKKGYNVSSSTNFGVLDIVVTPKIKLFN